MVLSDAQVPLIQRIDHLYIDPHTNDKILLHHEIFLIAAHFDFCKNKPDEIYNLGKPCGASFDNSEYTADVDGMEH